MFLYILFVSYRSGQYVYKPMMKKMCCPSYTIKYVLPPILFSPDYLYLLTLNMLWLQHVYISLDQWYTAKW